MKVRGSPGVPSGGVDQGATCSIGRNLIRRRPHRLDAEATFVVGDEDTAQVPFRQPGSELRVEPEAVRVPEFDDRAGERRAVDGADLPGEQQRSPRLVLRCQTGSTEEPKCYRLILKTS